MGRPMKILVVTALLFAMAACGGGTPLPTDGSGLAERPLNTTCLAGPQQAPAFDLSQTGCVDPQNPTQGASALIPYEINVPLWSDGAVKHRWMALPEGESINIDENGDWFFPVGSVLVKQFSIAGQVVETRLLMYHDNGTWAGYSYEWNEAGTQATLVDAAGKIRTLSNGQSWYYPGRMACFNCHTAAAGRTLGPENPQMNRLFTYPSTGITANQITTLFSIGVLGQDPGNPETIASFFDWEAGVFPEAFQLEGTARAYLHTNCSFCHRPGGPGGGNEDFRYQTPLAQMNSCDEPPLINDLGITNAKLIAPGDPDHSIVPFRMGSLEGGVRMPPLATFVVDDAGLKLIRDWITQLTSCN